MAGRGRIEGLVIKLVGEEKKKIKNKFRNKLRQAAKEVAEEYVEQIIIEWFNGYNYASTLAAIKVHVSVTDIGDDSLDCRVKITALSEEFFPDTWALERWQNRAIQKGKIGGKQDPAFWIMHLIFDMGYLGPPEVSSVSSWVNPNPIYFGPLREYITGHSLWGSYVAEVKSRIGL